jgi:hypothetical protein
MNTYWLNDGLIFFSYLNSASVLKPSLTHVFLTHTGSKLAISTKIFFVSSLTHEFNHPTTPAKAKTFSSSAITISVATNSCSFSNKSTNFSHSLACLTMIFHFTLSASKK